MATITEERGEVIYVVRLTREEMEHIASAVGQVACKAHGMRLFDVFKEALRKN